jgi:predicted TIM-barrel fold metal-dependent hydrolase
MLCSRRGNVGMLLVGVAVAVGATSCWFCGNSGVAPPTYDPKPGVPLTVDVHAHVVNGQDLPIYGYVTKVYYQNKLVFGAAEGAAIRVLEEVIHHFAPPYAAEAAELCGKIRAAKKPLPPICSAPEVMATAALAWKRPQSLPTNPTGLSPDEPQTYLRERLLQDPALRDNVTRGLRGMSAQLHRPDLLKGPLSASTPLSAAALSEQVALSFVDMFGDLIRDFSSWRLNNLYALEWLYPDVGIFVGHSLDFDKWLDEDAPVTPAQQDDLAMLLAIVSDGRFMPFVAFDPRRDSESKGMALKAVQEAIEQGGAVGVKLYPPMGFQPSGNLASLPIPGGGLPIETSLWDLYRWCADNGVPILAHTGEKNYAPNGEEAADPENWRPVLEKYPDLRIDLAHFGGQTEPNSYKWQQTAIGLFGSFHNVYADVACLVPELDAPPNYWPKLKTEVGGNRSIAGRLLYGSDWSLLSACVKTPAAFESTMRNTLQDVVGADQSLAVFGNNAVAFMGLRHGQPARGRLDAFYKRYRIVGKWRYQVDGLPAPAVP